MLDALLGTLTNAYDPAHARELLVAIWQQERWFDTPRQRAAAEIARFFRPDELVQWRPSDIEQIYDFSEGGEPV